VAQRAAPAFRLSFSGELAFEISAPTHYGAELLNALFKIGKVFDVEPYGTEALSVLRIEKGIPRVPNLMVKPRV